MKFSILPLLFLCVSIFIVTPLIAQVEPYDLTVEYMTAPVGIDTPNPRLSWKSKATDKTLKNIVQTAYQILVASSPEILAENKADLWDSGKIESDQSLNIEYAGKTLQTSQRCYWKVNVWYNNSCNTWSPSSSWIMGVMRSEDWKAQWIASDKKFRPDYSFENAKWIWCGNATDLSVAPQGKSFFRTVFDYQPQDEGIIAITADDEYKVFINGNPVTQTWGHFNDWKWTRFIDITKNLQNGKNVIGVEVSNKSKGPTGLLLRLNKVVTDSTWQCASEPADGWNSKIDFQNEKWRSAVEVGSADCEPWGKIERRTETISPAFYKELNLGFGNKKLKHATLHITGLGFYEVYLDWKKIGNKVLDPVQTRYDKRIMYSTYDLTEQFSKNEYPHFVTVLLGHGWYDVRSVAVWNFDNAPWRDFPRFLAQLELEYDDGSKAYIVSDETWKQIESPIIFDCIRQGEVSTGNLRRAELDCNAIVVDAPKGKLVAEALPPTVITQELKPVKITEPKPNVYVVDFGQNFAGWMRLRMKGPQSPISSILALDNETRQHHGDIVKIRYGERLAKDGTVEMKPINEHFRHHVPFGGLITDKFNRDILSKQFSNADRFNTSAPSDLHFDAMFQTDLFLCRVDDSNGLNELTYEPRFMYHGFQYVEITGLRDKPNPDWVTGCVVHTDFRTTGKFECSNELFNKIQQATLWSYRSNFVNGVPTDCPHREKNGWTGDAQLAVEQAQYNWDNTAGYEKWINDLLDEQQDNGNLPGIVPTSGWGYAWGNGPAWDSAIVLIPWILYEYKGDKRILEQSYNGMKKYVDYLTSRAKPNGLVYRGLSDWCYAKTKTDAVVTSSVYYFIDAKIVSDTAIVLDKKEDAEKYRLLAEKIRNAYIKEFFKSDGTIANASQTAQSFPLYYHLVADSVHASTFDHEAAIPVKLAFQKLVEAITKANNHLDVGILGAKSLFHTLSRYGRTDLAMTILNQKDYPSYGSWFERGATTLWEDWGDGSSRNHVMFGDISTWFYQTLGGIKNMPTVTEKDLTDEFLLKKLPLAFKNFTIKPEYPVGLDWVNAEHNSPYGLISVSWKRDGTKIK
ncbi:MAG: glycoside hydrolase family 78 protein, partial [Planctomycetaceae bacterium]|nr:glycoside hydrolase family 78 protein [Planctomycetaceae bacterium]